MSKEGDESIAAILQAFLNGARESLEVSSAYEESSDFRKNYLQEAQVNAMLAQVMATSLVNNRLAQIVELIQNQSH